MLNPQYEYVTFFELNERDSPSELWPACCSTSAFFPKTLKAKKALPIAAAYSYTWLDNAINSSDIAVYSWMWLLVASALINGRPEHVVRFLGCCCWLCIGGRYWCNTGYFMLLNILITPIKS